MSKIDPDIAAALEGYVEDGGEDEDNAELEDDFVQLAGGQMSGDEEEQGLWSAALQREMEDEEAGRQEMMRRFGLVREQRRRSSSMSDDEEDDKEEMDERKMVAQQREDAMSQATTKNDGDDDKKSRFTNYSMSSAVIKRPGGLRQIDDHFEHLYATQYAEEMEGEGIDGNDDQENEEEGNEDDGDDEEEANADDEKPNNSSKRFQSLLAEEMEGAEPRFRREIPDPALKQAVLRYAEAADAQREETEQILVPADGAKRARWDCESIVSTYSNIYNHPTEIGADSFPTAAIGGNKRKSQRNSGLTKGGLGTLEDEEKMDIDVPPSGASVRSTASTFRPKGETPEERRQRKQAIKEERRERRQEKKANRVAFHEQKLALDSQRKGGNQRQKIRPIK